MPFMSIKKVGELREMIKSQQLPLYSHEYIQWWMEETLKNREMDTKIGAVHECLLGQLGHEGDRGNNNISYLDSTHRWMDCFEK